MTPKSKESRNNDDFPNKAIYNLATIIFFCGLIGLYSQISGLENTIKGTRLFWLSALIGIFVGVGSVLVLKRKFSTLLNESNRRFTVILGFPLGLFLLIPAIGNFLNTELASSKTDCIETPVLQKFTEGTRNSSYHLKLDIDGGVEAFKITNETYNLVSAGDTLQVCIQHGFLGYDFVYGFHVISRR